MLNVPRASAMDTHGRTVVRHGPVERVGMVLAGVLISLAFGALTAALAAAGWRDLHGRGVIVGGVISTLFLGLAGFGVHLTWRGVRGRSTYRARFARLNDWPNQPANRRRFLIAVAVGYLALLTGIVVHLGSTPFVKLQRGWGDGGDSLIWFMALWMLALPVHVAVHELGHAVAGSLAGFRLVSIRIGPFLFRREHARWRLERKSTVIPVGVDGFVGAIPEDDDPPRALVVTFLAGGVLPNLALAIPCFVALSLAPSPTTDVAAIAHGVLVGVAWAGAFMAFANLLPMRVGVFRTDGWHILRTLSTTEAAKVLRRIGLVSARGRRPRNWGWNAEALRDLAKRSPRHADELSYLAFLVALDRKQPEVAVVIQSWFFERWTLLDSAVRGLVTYQTALARALEGEPGAASEILRAADGATKNTGVLGLLEATVAAADEDGSRARTHLAHWEDAVSATGLPGARVGLEWAVDALDARVGDGGQAQGVA